MSRSKTFYLKKTPFANITESCLKCCYCIQQITNWSKDILMSNNKSASCKWSKLLCDWIRNKW